MHTIILYIIKSVRNYHYRDGASINNIIVFEIHRDRVVNKYIEHGYEMCSWSHTHIQYRYGVRHGKLIVIKYGTRQLDDLSNLQYTIYNNGKKLIGIYYTFDRPANCVIYYSFNPIRFPYNPRNPRKPKLRRFFEILNNFFTKKISAQHIFILIQIPICMVPEFY